MKIVPLVQETIATVKRSLDTELEFDIFLVIDGREACFVMGTV